MELTLNLTHACNLGCSYCNAGTKSARAMDFATGRAGILLALDEAPGDGLDLAFFGGEPLLELELLLALADEARRLAAARGVPCRLAVTTNGTLLDAAAASALAARDVHLGLSLDGTAAAQDATRPFAGGRSTAAALERALDLALARFAKLSVISVIDPGNVTELAAGVARLVGRGVRRIVLNPNWLADWADDRLPRWEAAYRANARLWVARHREGRPFVLSTIDPKVWRHLVEPTGCLGCGFGRGELAVAPSGRLYPCGRAVGEDPADPADSRRALCLGDVATGVREAARAALPRPGALPEECRACALRRRCSNRCGCSNLESSGDPAVPSGLLCWHETMSIPVADAAAAELYAERDPSFMARFYGEAPRSAARLPLATSLA